MSCTAGLRKMKKVPWCERPNLKTSMSSGAELQSHFYVALDQKYIPRETFDRIYQQADKVGKMDSNLISYLRECDRKYAETKKT